MTDMKSYTRLYINLLFKTLKNILDLKGSKNCKTQNFENSNVFQSFPVNRMIQL